MKGFIKNIEEATLKNKDFRHVLYTAKHSQLVLMSLKPGEEIGNEVHENVDQFFRIEKGEGVVIIDGKKHKIKDGTAIIVPAGAWHNVINTSKKQELKLYTIYSPPEHKDKTIRHTKEDAEKMPEKFDGITTE
ncbi:MAG: cupin domain-containing protein [Candidatus Aenigmatarchaeota archaeon]|nr:cupin domain-containing protein [Candidatus Aenigmarchaeota archaeon]